MEFVKDEREFSERIASKPFVARHLGYLGGRAGQAPRAAGRALTAPLAIYLVALLAICLLPLPAICLPALPAPAKAPSQENSQSYTRVGDLLVKVPAGWKQSKAEESTVLAAPTASEGVVSAVVLAEAPIETDLATTFDNDWKVLEKTYQMQRTSEIAPLTMTGGHKVLYCAAMLSNGTSKMAALVVLIENGSQAESILFLTNQLQGQGLQDQKTAFLNFMSSLRFAKEQDSGSERSDRPPAAVRAEAIAVPSSGRPERASSMRGAGNSLTPGKFSGLYRSADGTKPEYLLFFPDGRMRRKLPNAALNGYDDAFWMANDIRSGTAFLIAPWGTYKVNGDHGTITFVGNRQTWEFQVLPDHLEVRGHSYYRLDPGAGARLAGTFQAVGDASKSITFKPDGSVIDKGVTANCGSNYTQLGSPSVGPGMCTADPRVGRYATVDFGLKLTFAQSSYSPNPTLLFWLDPGARDGDIRVIYIENQKYQRVQ